MLTILLSWIGLLKRQGHCQEVIASSDKTLLSEQYIEESRNKVEQIQEEKTTIKEALRILSEKSGVNISVENEVDGYVAIPLNGENIWEVLNHIIQSNDLAYKNENDILKVMTTESFLNRYGYSFSFEKQIKTIPLSYIDSSEIMGLLAEIKSPSGLISYDQGTNALILKDTRKKIQEMEKLIKEVDVFVSKVTFPLNVADVEILQEKINSLLTLKRGKMWIDHEFKKITVMDTEEKIKEIHSLIKKHESMSREIAYDVKILQIVLNEENEDGIDWAAIVSDYQQIEFGNKNESKKINAQEEIILSLGTVSEEDYTVLLEALDTVGEIKTLASFKKKILFSKNLIIDSQMLEGLSDESSGNRKLFKDTITPCVSIKSINQKDSFLSLRILSKKSLDCEDKNKKGTDPSLQSEAMIKVKNDSTVVIGSLFRDVLVESLRKIPLLGDLPLLGFAFRNQGRLVRRTETLIFISPKVIIKK